MKILKLSIKVNSILIVTDIERELLLIAFYVSHCLYVEWILVICLNEVEINFVVYYSMIDQTTKPFPFIHLLPFCFDS